MKLRMTIALSAITALVVGALICPLSTRAQDSPPLVDPNLPVAPTTSAATPSPEPQPVAGAPPTANAVPADPSLQSPPVYVIAPGTATEDEDEELSSLQPPPVYVTAPPATTGAPAAGNYSTGTRTVIVGTGNPFGMIVPDTPSNAIQWIQEVRKMAAVLRDAETNEDKAKAQQQLTQLVEQYFDKDMKRREDELAKIEERLRKLREQLELRRAKKKEIIDLQIKVAENEAQGLGFFSQPTSDLQPGRSGAPGMGPLGQPTMIVSPPPTPAVPYNAPSSTAPLRTN